jgi:hypothetical protein
MDTYELGEPMELSPAERPTLSCIKVRGQTRGTLLGLTTQLGARLCIKSFAASTSFDRMRKMATLLLLALPSHSA